MASLFTVAKSSKQNEWLSVERFMKLFYIMINKHPIKMINSKCIRRICRSYCWVTEANSEMYMCNNYTGVKIIFWSCIEICIHIYLQLIIWTQKIHRDYSLSRWIGGMKNWEETGSEKPEFFKKDKKLLWLPNHR